MAENHDKTLRIALDARLPIDHGSGGMESVLIGLVRALGRLTDGPEEYLIIGPSENAAQWKPHIGANQHIVPYPRARSRQLTTLLPRPLRPVARRVRDSFRARIGLTGVPQYPPLSSGFYESLNCDVIHFPSTAFEICALPSVYNILDLQHLHFPQYFNAQDIASREVLYPTACRLAGSIVVTAQWVKEDIVRHYGIHPNKVQVISWAPPSYHYVPPSASHLDAIRSLYNLPEPFALYPSKTYPHKNHLRLLEALALLRDRRGLKVHFICTGLQFFKGSSWPLINETLRRLRLEDQVLFLGLIPSDHLRALYRLAQFVMIPSLFEAFSAPLGEAMQEGTPAACSRIRALREEAGDTAFMFDPMSTEAIADALATMATNTDLRTSLIQKSRARLSQYDSTWERTAKTYRALYRRTAGLQLTDEDGYLLGLDSHRTLQERQVG